MGLFSGLDDRASCHTAAGSFVAAKHRPIRRKVDLHCPRRVVNRFVSRGVCALCDARNARQERKHHLVCCGFCDRYGHYGNRAHRSKASISSNMVSSDCWHIVLYLTAYMISVSIYRQR